MTSPPSLGYLEGARGIPVAVQHHQRPAGTAVRPGWCARLLAAVQPGGQPLAGPAAGLGPALENSCAI
jgi:hypothetical protein